MKKNIRKVHVNNEEWHYRVGCGGSVTIYAPNSKIPFKLNGKDWHNVDDPGWTVKPSNVKQYIIDNLIQKRLKEGIE